MKKYLVKFNLCGKSRQRTVKANNIYEAERLVRNELLIPERSDSLFVKTIKCGRAEYQVFGTTL